MGTVLIYCERLPQLPVMLLTANDTDIVDELGQCTDDYIAKPFSADKRKYITTKIGIWNKIFYHRSGVMQITTSIRKNLETL